MAGSCPHQILITGNPRRTRADFVARRRQCLITEREAKKEANKNRRNSRCSALRPSFLVSETHLFEEKIIYCLP